MTAKRRLLKKYDFGGGTALQTTNTTWAPGGVGGNYSSRIQLDAKGNAIDPLASMYKEHDATDKSLTGAVAAIPGYGPLFAGLAGIGTAASRGITGKGTNRNANVVGNLANPWNQFEDNRNAKDWAGSFLNPFGSSLMKGKRLKMDVDAYNDRVRQQTNRDNMLSSGQAIQGWDSTGSDSTSLYNAKFGGEVKSPLRSLATGGSLNKLNSDSFEVEGQSHEEGGVTVPSMNAELEGGETGVDNFIFSEELGFADLHKPIAKAIGKIEVKPDSKIKRDTISLLKQKESVLAQQQEALKEVLGLGENAASYMH